MAEALIGLDVGTSAVKALAIDDGGREAGTARVPVTWSTSRGGTELDAEVLVGAVNTALHSVLRSIPDARVAGVGVASMGESGVLLDARGAPLTPLIAWHDRRDADLVADLDRDLGAGRFSRHTGLPLWSQWSLSKHRWLRDHAPTTAGARRRLDVAGWVVSALGGEQASELSLASRTGWLDLARRSWWDESLEWSGADPGLLPPLVTAGEPLGRVTTVPELAGAVLTVAGHDHQAAVIGVGATAPGAEFDSCGTAEALVRTVPPDLPEEAVAALAGDGITVGWHALAGHWCLLGGTQGGLALQHVLRLLGRTQDDVPALDAAAMALPGSVVDLDLTDPVHPQVLTGNDADEAHVWRAALDAVTRQAASVHAAMSRTAGPHHSVTAAGGWSRSAGLVARKRALLGPVELSPVREPGARGAALLAGLASGVFASMDDLPGPSA